ncbi:MAG: hypothetical protein E6H78_19830, partial [Betaproteobacteria bacterium]
MPAKHAPVEFLVRHHEEILVRMTLRAVDLILVLDQDVIRIAVARAAAHADVVHGADDIDTERFERVQVDDLGVRAAGRHQPQTEIHVVVMDHRLVTGDRLVV